MIGHRLLSDADLAGTRPVSEAELQAVIEGAVKAVRLRDAMAAVCSMDDETFFAAAVAIGLDPWAGMRRDRVTNERTWGTGRKARAA